MKDLTIIFRELCEAPGYLKKGVGGQNINHKVTQPTASLPPRVILMNHNKPYQLARATFVWSRLRLRVQLSCRLKI